MAFSLKNIIFGFFGRYEAQTDTFKDVDGKGLKQRFQEEIVGKEYDDELEPLLESLFDNTISPQQARATFLPYMIQEDGVGFALIGDESLRRKAVAFHKAIVARKGTEAGFALLFNLFGVTDYTLSEQFRDSSLDDANRVLDDENRRLDSECTCPLLDLSVEYTGLSSSQIETAIRAIPSIIAYNLPVTIQQGIVTFYDIELQIQAGGTVTIDLTALGSAVVDWGDNTVETIDASLGSISHQYTGVSLYPIRIVFLDRPSFQSLSYTDGGVFGVSASTDLINNGPSFDLDLRNNLFNEDRIIELCNRLLRQSDSLQANAITIDLRGNVTTSISPYAFSLIDDLKDNHDITILVAVTPAVLTTTTEGVGGIRLDWVDASVDISDYEIYRKTAITPYALVATVAGGVFTYLDDELEDNRQYSYQIKAVNTAGQSALSNEDSATTRNFDLELQFTANQMTVDFLSSIGQDVQWRIVEPTYQLNTHTLGTSLVISEMGGATARFYFDDKASVTDITIDANAQLRGQVDLDSGYTALLNYTAQNGDYDLLPNTWVRKPNVAIDVTNSAFSDIAVSSLIDRVIIANGGTVSDDGSNFTGTAGETHAGRSLIVGTIILDLSDPANSVLFQKITALEGVGWTITTVLTLCQKSLNINTGSSSFIASELEKTRQLLGFDYVSGDPLDIKLYDTEANAQTGGATGLLADGYSAVSAWLLDDANYNAWVFGNPKGIRFEAVDTASQYNAATLRYKALPTNDRVCGENDLYDFFAGNAKAYNESGYDEFDFTAIASNNETFSVLVSFDEFTNNNFSELLLLKDDAGRTRYYAAFISNQIRWFANSDSNNSVPPDGVKRVSTTTSPNVSLESTQRKVRVILTYDGATKEMQINIDGVRDDTILLAGTPNGTFTPASIRIGDSERLPDGVGAKRLRARVRRFEVIDFIPTAGQIAKADESGSFRAIADASSLLLDVDYNRVSGLPITTAGTPPYSNTGIGDNNYEDFNS